MAESMNMYDILYIFSVLTLIPLSIIILVDIGLPVEKDYLLGTPYGTLVLLLLFVIFVVLAYISSKKKGYVLLPLPAGFAGFARPKNKKVIDRSLGSKKEWMAILIIAIIIVVSLLLISFLLSSLV